ncbi:DUF4352 domain-containing protein [Rhodococcus kronopolitis]|uniref:DUF4352 domain-containing protein n=1 Tax=Rhodococcus kronopolitis TaxID=1460226 RepID=A0ABV9FQ60_9NOCA
MSTPQGPGPNQPYPQQWSAAPVPPPAPKKSRKWPWIVGVLAALFVIGIATGGDKDEATPAPTAAAPAQADGQPVAPAAAPAAAEPAAADTSAAGIGNPVRDGKFEFTVTNVESGLSELGDNPYLVEKAQGQFVVVTMTVLNTSDKPKSISPGSQKLFDAQGRTFTADPTAALNLDTDVAIWDEINPGNSVTMKIVYDMPADAAPASMELHDSMFSGGAKVNLQ